MTELKIVTLNGGERAKETNAPIAGAFEQLSEDATNEADRKPVGNVPLMPCLGVIAMPYPPDKRGKAEAVIAEGLGGLPAVCVAGWDTRSFQACANMKPGDWSACSTGPNNAAQLLLKEEKRQCVLAAKKANGKQIMFMMDANTEVVQILANKATIEINKAGDINLSDGTGKAGITISGDTIHLRCSTLNIGGMVPTFQLAQVPPLVGFPATFPTIAIPPAAGIWLCK